MKTAEAARAKMLAMKSKAVALLAAKDGELRALEAEVNRLRGEAPPTATVTSDASALLTPPTLPQTSKG